MNDIQSLLKEFNNKKIDAEQLKNQLADVIEPYITSQADLDQEVIKLKKDYHLPKQTWDGVKTIITESLQSKTRIQIPKIQTPSSQTTQIQTQAQKNTAETIVANNSSAETIVSETSHLGELGPDSQTIVHIPQATSSTDANAAETIVAQETFGAPNTRHEQTKNYLDPNRPMQESAPLKPGSILKNRFILEKELGHGGMSIVYRALDLRKQEANNRNPYIAIKLLGSAFKNHPQSIRVLEHETQKIQNLAHPNIITVYDFDRDGDAIYMTMECLDGASLDVLIRDNNTGLETEKALPIIQAMANALAYAHSKDIIHSDLKPENVFVTKDNIVKVLDFGIARAKKIPEQNRSSEDKAYEDFDGSNLGALTPSYASPEMFDDADPDAKDDIYALGCVTYKLLTGRHPFNENQSNHARDEGMVLKKIDALTRKQWLTLASSLAFNPDERVASIADFLDGMVPKKRGIWFYASIIGTCIALIISGYAWYSASQKPTLPKIHLSAEQKQQITNYQETAELYFDMGYFASPPGDSAYDQYQKILEIDPTNQIAFKGMKKIAVQYERLAREKLEANDLEESLLLVKTGLIVEPDNENLLRLKNKINKRKMIEE